MNNISQYSQGTLSSVWGMCGEGLEGEGCACDSEGGEAFDSVRGDE